MPNHSPEHYPPKEKMLRRVILHLFFLLSDSEKLSEIMLLLAQSSTQSRKRPARAEVQTRTWGVSGNTHAVKFLELLWQDPYHL